MMFQYCCRCIHVIVMLISKFKDMHFFIYSTVFRVSLSPCKLGWIRKMNRQFPAECEKCPNRLLSSDCTSRSLQLHTRNGFKGKEYLYAALVRH